MFTQTFAVVANDYDQGVFIAPGFLQVSDEVCQRRIGVGDFAVVQPIFVGLRIRGWWLVGIVRVVQMYPNKMGTGGMSGHPCFGMLHYVHTAALNSSPA